MNNSSKLTYQNWLNDIEYWKSSRKTKTIGKNVITFQEVDSTNAYLKKHTELPHGTIAIAYMQTKGKGQKSRIWDSSPGGLYFTIKLEFSPLPVLSPFWILATVAIGLCKGLNALDLNPIIKWPNDVLIGGKKIAGILGEFIFKEPFNAFLGIGVNMNNSLESVFKTFPNLGGKITSLLIEKNKFIPYSFILDHICSYLESQMISNTFYSLTKIKTLWLNYAQILNKNVTIIENREKKRSFGKVKEITDFGSLIITLNSGITKEYIVGDIQIKIN